MASRLRPSRLLLPLAASLALASAIPIACSAVGPPHSSGGGHGGSMGTGGGIALEGGTGCPLSCSADLHAVVDCAGIVREKCSGLQGCDSSARACTNACAAAATNRQSVGCEYYATDLDQRWADLCFAAYVANTWNTPAHLQVELGGTALPVGAFTFIPRGTGTSLTFEPYDPAVGLPPDEVAVLFLAGTQGANDAGAMDVHCPQPAATTTDQAQILHATGKGRSFRITTSVPVVAYQINPFGGGDAAVTGASLLLPTSAWDGNYVAVTPPPTGTFGPSMNIIAAEAGTTVTVLPTAAIAGGGGLPAGAANKPYIFSLDQGEMAQLTPAGDLTGSIISADRPVGLMAGHPCMEMPVGIGFCDHAEQMVPPVRALGSEYVGVMYRPRVDAGDQAIWHLVGAVAGTTFTYSSPVGGPAMLGAGESAEFITDQPFVVKSQDDKHPFLLFSYMTGSQWNKLSAPDYGDPDFVLDVPPQQYLSRYVFFTDPTYPETDLVVVRRKNQAMAFDDVTLDCAGALAGWQPVGEYEWTRIDLVRHDFLPQGNCTNGRHVIQSASPFGLWVWGWGSPETTKELTWHVSYGYPGGMNVSPINTVVIEPTPK